MKTPDGTGSWIALLVLALITALALVFTYVTPNFLESRPVYQQF